MMFLLRLASELRIRQADPEAVVVLSDEDPGGRSSRRRITIQVGNIRMRRRGIRLDGPVNALAVADGVAGHHHRSGRRTSHRWARRRRVTAATQWKWTHEQLVVSRARSEVHPKFAVAAR